MIFGAINIEGKFHCKNLVTLDKEFQQDYFEGQPNTSIKIQSLNTKSHILNSGPSRSVIY